MDAWEIIRLVAEKKLDLKDLALIDAMVRHPAESKRFICRVAGIPRNTGHSRMAKIKAILVHITSL